MLIIAILPYCQPKGSPYIYFSYNTDILPVSSLCVLQLALQVEVDIDHVLLLPLLPMPLVLRMDFALNLTTVIVLLPRKTREKLPRSRISRSRRDLQWTEMDMSGVGETIAYSRLRRDLDDFGQSRLLVLVLQQHLAQSRLPVLVRQNSWVSLVYFYWYYNYSCYLYLYWQGSKFWSRTSLVVFV